MAQKQYSEKAVGFTTKTRTLECPEHGQCIFVWETVGRRYRCRACNTQAILKRKVRIKSELIAAHGGKCSKCGYNNSISALHFHHTDPTKKKFLISSLTSHSKAKVFEEVKHCALLCANCHAEIEDELRWAR